MGSNGCIHDDRIWRAAKAFVGHGIGVVAQPAKIISQFNREIFVQLKLHTNT